MWSNSDSVRLQPISETEADEAKQAFIKTRADELIESNLLDLFLEMNGDEATYLRSLLSCSILEFSTLQQAFNDRIRHEAETWAMREWTPTRQALTYMAVQDGRCE